MHIFPYATFLCTIFRRPCGHRRKGQGGSRVAGRSVGRWSFRRKSASVYHASGPFLHPSPGYFHSLLFFTIAVVVRDVTSFFPFPPSLHTRWAKRGRRREKKRGDFAPSSTTSWAFLPSSSSFSLPPHQVVPPILCWISTSVRTEDNGKYGTRRKERSKQGRKLSPSLPWLSHFSSSLLRELPDLLPSLSPLSSGGSLSTSRHTVLFLFWGENGGGRSESHLILSLSPLSSSPNLRRLSRELLRRKKCGDSVGKLGIP